MQQIQPTALQTEALQSKALLTKAPQAKVLRYGKTWPTARPVRALLSMLLLSSACVAGHAEPVREDQIFAGPCTNCHGPDGRSPGAIPSIAGLPEQVLNAKLTEYKSDTPPAGTTVMNRLAKGYSDAQLATLARYYAQMKPATGSAAGVKQ